MKVPRVTFVLPGGGPSGGVRVTVEMARRLMDRGHKVRIAHRHPPLFSKEYMGGLARGILRRLERAQNFDWVRQFLGANEAYTDFNKLDFCSGEIVIAVGEHAVQDVYELKRDVLKVRYCHGFFDDLPELNKYAWGVPMPTISVSQGLVPQLERYAEARVLAVVPN